MKLLWKVRRVSVPSSELAFHCPTALPPWFLPEWEALKCLKSWSVVLLVWGSLEMCGCQTGIYLFKRRGGNPVVICPGSSSPSASLGESSRWSGPCKAQAKGSVAARGQTPRSLRDEPSTELCLGMLFPWDPCPAWQREGVTGTWVGSPCPPHQGNELKAGLANRSQWINRGNDLLCPFLLC